MSRHLGLARKLAARYRRTQEPFEDLFQVASLGLVKAIDRFDHERGAAFSSFAVPTILGELKRYFRDKGWSVHLSRGLQELVLRVQEAETRLGLRTGRSPTVPEIAQYLSLDTEQILEALDAIHARTAVSLEAPVGNDAAGEAMSSHDIVGAEDDHYQLIDTVASLDAAVGRLSAPDREVFALRFGNGLKQREIADRIGVSQMQVSRILRRITDQLGHDLERLRPTAVGSLPATR